MIASLALIPVLALTAVTVVAGVLVACGLAGAGLAAWALLRDLGTSRRDRDGDRPEDRWRRPP